MGVHADTLNVFYGRSTGFPVPKYHKNHHPDVMRIPPADLPGRPGGGALSFTFQFPEQDLLIQRGLRLDFSGRNLLKAPRMTVMTGRRFITK